MQVKITLYYLFISFTLLPLFACQKLNNKSLNIDFKSYIKDFVLIQENEKRNTNFIITSPNAIIDPLTNDIELSDSLITILSKNGDDVEVISGNSSLYNSKQLIKVFNDVHISLLDKKNYYIETNAFDWDLKSSNINLDNPLYINLDNTTIKSLKGIYNIQTNLLKLNNNIFLRRVFNENGVEEYQVEILSDFAKWLKHDNSLEFTSNNKQVETTIRFLRVK